METTVELVNNFVKSTSRLRLLAHCRDMRVDIEGWSGEESIAAVLRERVSSITLWSSLGRIKLNVHFDVDTAVSWAACGLGKHEDQIDDEIAVDFMREYSNLHAGYLRGIFESKGLDFSMTLPFVSADMDLAPQKPKVHNFKQAAWGLTDGRKDVRYTAEIELADALQIEMVRAALESSVSDEANLAPNTDGLVEFLLT